MVGPSERGQLKETLEVMRKERRKMKKALKKLELEIDRLEDKIR